MSEATQTLETEVPTGVEVTIPVDGLQHDDIDPGTGKVFVDGTEEPKAALGFAQFGKILVRNNTGKTWPADTELRVTWDAHASGGASTPPASRRG
jgi:hypothetical protein